MQADQNTVDYQVFPTKQAKGEEPKLHQVTEWRKKPWEKPNSVLLWPTANSV